MLRQNVLDGFHTKEWIQQELKINDSRFNEICASNVHVRMLKLDPPVYCLPDFMKAVKDVGYDASSLAKKLKELGYFPGTKAGTLKQMITAKAKDGRLSWVDATETGTERSKRIFFYDNDLLDTLARLFGYKFRKAPTPVAEAIAPTATPVLTASLQRIQNDILELRAVVREWQMKDRARIEKLEKLLQSHVQPELSANAV